MGAFAIGEALFAPNVAFCYFADRPALNQFDDAAIIAGGVDLRSHLRRQVFLPGRESCDYSGLVDGMRQGFFAVYVLAEAQGCGGRDGMSVIGGGDNDRVDAWLLEHLSEIVVGFRLGKTLARSSQQAVIDIAQSDDILLLHAIEVFASAVRRADHRNVELLVRGEPSRPGGPAPRQGHSAGRKGGHGKKMAA